MSNEHRVQALATAAERGGFPGARNDLVLLARSDFDRAVATVRLYLERATPTPTGVHLFTRIPEGASTIGARDDLPGAMRDLALVENALGRFAISGAKFSAIAMQWADAKDGEIKGAIDELLTPETVSHPGERLIAANRLLRERRPDLWAAAERPL